MITKVMGNPGTYRGINTDHSTGIIGQDIIIEQTPEETEDRVWVLDAIQYSYKPVQGNPKIDGGIVVMVGEKVKFDADIPDFTGVLNLYIPSQTDKTISVTLKAGGPSVIGKLNCQWHLEAAQ